MEALVGSGWERGSRRVLSRYHGSFSTPLPWPSDPTVVQLENFPIHAVTGVLKQWLRELPEPLMTFAQYSDFLRAVGEAGCCPGGGWGIPGGPGLGGRVTWWMPGPHGHCLTPRTAREGRAAGGDLLGTRAPARGQPQVPGAPDLPPSQASASCGEGEMLGWRRSRRRGKGDPGPRVPLTAAWAQGGPAGRGQPYVSRCPGHHLRPLPPALPRQLGPVDKHEGCPQSHHVSDSPRSSSALLKNPPGAGRRTLPRLCEFGVG